MSKGFHYTAFSQVCAFDAEDDSDANDKDDDGDNSMCNSLKFRFLYLNTFQLCCNGEFLFTINVLSLNQKGVPVIFS